MVAKPQAAAGLLTGRETWRPAEARQQASLGWSGVMAGTLHMIRGVGPPVSRTGASAGLG